MTEDLNRGMSEDTGAEVEGAEGARSTGEMATGEMSTGASITGTEGAEVLIGQASVMIAQPGPGQTREISAELGRTYDLRTRVFRHTPVQAPRSSLNRCVLEA